MRALCGIAMMASAVAQVYPSTLLNYNFETAFPGCAVLSQDRLLIMGLICQTYVDPMAKDQCQTEAKQIVALLYDNAIPPVLINASYFPNPEEIHPVVGSFPTLRALQVEHLANPLVYATHFNHPGNVSVRRFEVYPNNSIVLTGTLKLITTLAATQPLFSALGNRTLYLVGYDGPNSVGYSITSVDLRTFQIKNYALCCDISVPTDPLPNTTGPFGEATYDVADGAFLLDNEYNRLILLAFDVFFIDASSLQLLNKMAVHQQLTGGVIDETRKRVYLVARDYCQLWRLSYNRSHIWKETFYSYPYVRPSEKPCPTVTSKFNPTGALLYVFSQYDYDLPAMTTWDGSNTSSKSPLTIFKNDSKTIIGSASQSPGYTRVCVEFTSQSVVIVQRPDAAITQFEIIAGKGFSVPCVPGANPVACYPCPRGTSYSNASCVPCPPFSYTPNTSMTACLPCTVPTDGQSACGVCPDFRVPDAAGHACVCIPGYSIDSLNSTGECTPCLLGTFKPDIGNDRCGVCPTSSVSTTDRTGCKCGPQSYKTGLLNMSDLNSFSCKSCPGGGLCDGSTVVVGKAGFWRPRGSNTSLVTFFECPVAAACAASDQCSAGYDNNSFLCGSCQAGYAVASSLTGCVQCDSANGWIVGLFVILAPLFIIHLFRATDADSEANVGIIIGHVQVLAEIGLAAASEQSAAFRAFFAGLRIFQFQFFSLSPNVCAYPGKNFLDQWLSQLFVTLILIGFTLVVGCCLRICAPKQLKGGFLPSLARVSVVILKFCFLGNTKLILIAFSCSSSDNQDPPVSYVNSGQGVTVFDYYPSLQCFSGEHGIIFGLGILFFIVYLIVTVLILVGLIFKNKYNVDVLFLTAPYTPECKYWELVVVARRFVVAVIAFASLGTIRNWLLTAAIFVSLIGSLLKRPYVIASSRVLDLASLHILHLSFALAVLFQGSSSIDLGLLVFILIINIGLVVFALRIIVLRVWRKAHNLITKVKERTETTEEESEGKPPNH